MKSEEKLKSLRPEDIEKFNKFIKNPVSTLIEESDDTNHESPNARVKKQKPAEETKRREVKNVTKTDKKEFMSSFNIENFKHLDKLQLHDVINRKKEEHERRIKALEKLTKLEKLQAEKLEKILKLNKSNDTSEVSQEENGSSRNSNSKRKAMAKKQRKMTSGFDAMDFSIGDDTIDMADMIEKDILSQERKYNSQR